MMKAVLVFAFATIAIGCCPHVDNSALKANSAVAKTNVDNANSVPYLRTENAYTFAQNSALAQDLSPSGKEAREIVGKTVTESNLWQNKEFSSRLRKLMGADYATMKKYWNIETPIKKFGDFLMMTGCEQNNCARNRYVIFVDLGDGSIDVVHIGKDAIRKWYANKKIDLPPPFADELAAMQSKE